MNPRELRIGNLLQDETTGEILRVSDIETETGAVEDKVRLTTYVLNREKFPLSDPWKAIPIEINEEWLVNFGKHKNTGIHVQENGYPRGDLFIDFKNNGKCFLQNCNDGYEFGIEIKYVHQLQNLYFALTGKELEYNPNNNEKD